MCNIELAFLVDASTKSDQQAWTQMLDFVSEIVRRYDIYPVCVRAAVITYSNTANAPILLTSYSNLNSLTQAIGQLPLLGGSSNLAAALNLLQSQVFAGNVVRANTARIAIIITDQLQSSPQITTAANSAKSQGITIVAVGITGPGRVDTNFTYSIRSNNSAIFVSDYSRLVSEARNTIVHQYGCFSPPTTPGTGMFS